MNLQEGTEVAVIVDGKWHAALCKALVLFEDTGDPFHLMSGKVSGSEHVGLWMLPDKTYTNVGLVQLFIPWNAIVTVAVIEEARKEKLGFHTPPTI